MKGESRDASRRILVLDVGGSHVKASFSDFPGREVRLISGPRMTPSQMTRGLKRLLRGKRYDAVAIGYPGLVRHGHIVRDPPHLGRGWVGFDFERAFRRPTRIVNDAAMQALGSYEGGHMLFLGLGTGLGSALIAGGVLQPMEIGHLPYRKGRTFEEYVGEEARGRLGSKKWRREVDAVVEILRDALEPDYIVLGGGNVRRLARLQPGTRRGDNRNAFRGGVRLWQETGKKTPGGTRRAARPARAVGKPRRKALERATR
jgi:predicted NBD/HSP70 family sugar kinase